MSNSDQRWQAVRVFGAGIQPQMARDWDCEPAWDIQAVYARADAVQPHPDPSRDKVRHLFWDRHIDKRYRIEYPLPTRDAPRPIGKTYGDPGKEWDVVIEHRDRYLAERGLTLQSPPAEIARCFAETFLCDSHFGSKPTATIFEDGARQIFHPAEGLLYQCWCAGCAPAFIAMAESCGLPARKFGIGGHHVAEVLIEGKWHFIENSGRHEKCRGLAAYFPCDFLELVADPARYREYMHNDEKVGQYWKAPNPQFHLTNGEWDSTKTLRYAASNAYALYPGHEHWAIKSEDGKRLPLIMRSGGFYWSSVSTGDRHAHAVQRQANCPFPVDLDNPPIADFFYHPLQPGDRLRQSVWLDEVADMEALEVTIPFAPEAHLDFSTALGSRLRLKVNEQPERSLLDLGAWPPAQPNNRGHRNVTVAIDPKWLKPHAVNWIELVQASDETMQAPFLPAAMEPYLPPLLTSVAVGLPREKVAVRREKNF